jgi:hypothetical protein
LSIGGNAATATTSSNITGGSAYAFPYQTGSGTTSFLSAGTSGQVLQTLGSASAPQWVSQSSLSVGSASNIVGGSAGVIPYQTAIGATGFTAVGSTGQLLQSNATSAPTWVNANTLSVASATNLLGGAAYSIPYQSALNATTFLAVGSSGQVLSVTSGGALTWATPTAYATVTDDTTTNATRYPLFANQTSGNLSTEYTSSTKLQYNPNTGTFTSTAFAGNLTGNVTSTSVAITGGTIDNTVIGGTTPSTGTFTTITGQTEILKGTGENFVRQSQSFTNTSYWTAGSGVTVTGGVTDPLGGTTASLLTGASGTTYNSSNLSQTIASIIPSATYTFSLYVQAVTATTGVIQLRDNSTGGITTTTFTPTSTWQRVSVTATSGSSTTQFNLQIGGTNGTLNIAFAQVEFGTVVNPYVATTTAQIYGTPTLSFSGVSTIGLQNDGALFVQPAGTGALQAQQTTSTATGGNARGANAVDWQTSRTAATMVASAQALIAGGQNNTASGTASSALGGYTNLVNANYATAVGGSYGTTRGVIGLVSIPASNQPLNVTTAGSTQSSMLVIGVQTTNATATALKSNTSAASATNQLVLPNGQTSTVSVYTFRALVSAHNTVTTDAAGWEIKGVISRGAAAANTALVGTPSVALLGATSGAISAGWGVVGAVAAVADTTNGALQIQVTGAASTTINWSATIETNELGY